MNFNNLLINSFGKVYGVDTKKVTINVSDEKFLNELKINDLVVFNGNEATEKLIGIINKVVKKINGINTWDDVDVSEQSSNSCIVSLIGTFHTKYGIKENIFKRVVNSYPEINSDCFRADNTILPYIMNALKSESTANFIVGKYSSDKSVDAILDGNKFFQRHACIVGSTGSGKSYTVVNILERADELPYSNIILFDLHGEYNELSYAKQIKIGCAENDLKIPLWFFNYEEIHSLFIESSEGTSSNQRAAVINFILKQKKLYIENNMPKFSPDIVTADTTVPFSSKSLLEYLDYQNTLEEGTGEFIKSGSNEGKEKTRQGQYYGKLTNLITRLQTKIDDKKYGFVFDENETNKDNFLNNFIDEVMSFSNNKIKIIDLSEVPSDMLPIIIGIITRLVYEVQFWNYPNKKAAQRHPLALICDEAHIYMPNDSSKLKSVEKKSLEIFEKIAKEGRKYGVGLVVVSQRPAELNTTIFSQCNNILALKITNDRDKSAVAGMLSDSMIGIIDLLPNLDVGECVVVGDSIMIPTKIILRDDLKEKPKSSTVNFWDRWKDQANTVYDLSLAIENMIKQSGN